MEKLFDHLISDLTVEIFQSSDLNEMNIIWDFDRQEYGVFYFDAGWAAEFHGFVPESFYIDYPNPALCTYWGEF